MTKKLINYLLHFLLITIFIFIFIYSNIVKETVINGINIWLYNLIPSMFPILLVTKLMIKYNIFEYINYLFGNLFEKLFRVNKNASFVIITSIFTGFPSGSIFTKELLLSNKINIKEANKLIAITSYSNPIFVISFVGETLLKSKILGFYIFIVHLISGLLIGILYNTKKDFKRINEVKSNNNKTNFINTLIEVINDCFNILINILGIFLFFFTISNGIF